jgi:hypothetical protein
MKTLPSVLLYVCIATTAFAESLVPESSVRTVVPEELRNLFKYPSEPGPSSASDLPIAADQPVVRMKPFIVPAYRELRTLPVIFQQQERLFKEMKFWLKNGGVLSLHAGKVFTADLQLNFRVHGNGADLFRISISW